MKAWARMYIASGPDPVNVVSASRSGSSKRSISVLATPVALFGDNFAASSNAAGRNHGDSAGAVARRQLARRHSLGVEAALAADTFLRHDHDFVARQGRADDRVRTGDVVGEAVAWRHFDLASILLEIGRAVGLEKDLDVGMLA